MKVNFILLTIIILIVLLSGCLNTNEKDEEIDDKENSNNIEVVERVAVDYLVKINPKGSFTYTLYSPLLVHGNWVEMKNENIIDGEILKINNNYSINGSGEINIISTQHGSAFQILGEGPIEIEIISDIVDEIDTTGGNPNTALSLLYDSNNDGGTDDEYHNLQYWVYSDISNNQSIDIDISLNVYYTKNSFSGKICLKGTIFNGWQLIDGTKEASAD